MENTEAKTLSEELQTLRKIEASYDAVKWCDERKLIVKIINERSASLLALTDTPKEEIHQESELTLTDRLYTELQAERAKSKKLEAEIEAMRTVILAHEEREASK